MLEELKRLSFSFAEMVQERSFWIYMGILSGLLLMAWLIFRVSINFDYTLKITGLRASMCRDISNLHVLVMIYAGAAFAICAAVGLGEVVNWNEARKKGRKKPVLPMALYLSGALVIGVSAYVFLLSFC